MSVHSNRRTTQRPSPGSSLLPRRLETKPSLCFIGLSRPTDRKAGIRERAHHHDRRDSPPTEQNPYPLDNQACRRGCISTSPSSSRAPLIDEAVRRET
jgi:hypothetical protein